MNIKYLIAFFCILSFLDGFSQNSKLSITSSSGNFFLLINNISQNPNESDTIHIRNFQEGSYHIKIINIDSIVSAEKTIYLYSNQHRQYEHIVEDSTGYIRLIGEQTENISDSIFYKYSQTNRISLDSISLKAKYPQKIKSILFPTISNYTGKKGCSSPNLINTQMIISKVENQMLTRKKKEVVLKELSDKCVQVSELKLILTTFEYEDSKLSVIKLLKPNIFDLGNIDQMDNLFQIRAYKESFNKFKKSL